MTLSLIDSALVDAYTSGTFGLPTAYENRDYEPTPGTAWAAVNIVPAQTNVATLGPSGEDNHPGFMQIDLYYPRGKGKKDALAKADAIYAYFYAGRTFTYLTQTVHIQTCSRSQGRNEDGWYRITMTVYYYARTTR